MVSGYPAIVRVGNWTVCFSPGCYPEYSGTSRVWGWVGTGPWFHLIVPTTLPPGKYFNFDCIATWSICKMCRLMPYFISHSQFCDQINIHWFALHLGLKSTQNDRVSIGTLRQLVWFQIGEWEMKKGTKLQISRIDHVTIQWQLQYFIVSRHVGFWRAGSGWKAIATVRFHVGTGPGTKPGIWTRC
jgi:hypothetical protein